MTETPVTSDRIDTTFRSVSDTVSIFATGPGTEPVLRPAISALRDRALARQSAGVPGPPALALADAAAWLEREPDEDWLVWRGRRTTKRLAMMPIDVSAGERIAGRPQLRPPTPEESLQIEAVSATLEAIPPYPGGDAGHFHPDVDKLFSLGIGVLARLMPQVQVFFIAMPLQIALGFVVLGLTLSAAMVVFTDTLSALYGDLLAGG